MYHKLVRNKIPEIMEAAGEKPVFRVMKEKEYRDCLAEKLKEEVNEYLEDETIEELADILEAVYALAEANGRTREELLAVYQAKHEVRGGFDRRIFLLGKE